MQCPCSSASAKHLNYKNHAPEMFDLNQHDTKVDIWGVGYLIQTVNFECSEELRNLMKILMNPNPRSRPDARDVFKTICEFQSQYEQLV